MGVQELKLAPNAPFSTFFLPDQLLSKPVHEMALIVRNRRGRIRANDEIDETNIDDPSLELCLTSTKGLGLFAKKDIKRGTCILSQAPLIVLPSRDKVSYHDLLAQLAKLDPGKQDLFYSLHAESQRLPPGTKQAIEYEAKVTKRPIRDENHLKMEKSKIITLQIKTNAVSISPDSGYAIFPLFSRVNHDCTPNVYASYNSTLKTHTVYATRYIKAQEELLTSYVDPAQPMRGRGADLLEFNIDCECASCILGKGFKTSERRRHSIEQARSGLAAYEGTEIPGLRPPDVVPRDPNLALNMAESAIDFMRAEQLVNMSLAKLHRQASTYALQLGRVEKAKGHAVQEAEVEKVCLGSETEYLNDFNATGGGGTAAAWAKKIERTIEKDRVKIRMCEKRVAKEMKKADKKAEKKAGKRGRR